jgi:monoamine oxidase
LRTRVLIVGGGLCGLALARLLARDGVDYLLVEARDRFGGRILSRPATAGADRLDLGPAWFWPGQPRIARLLRELGGASFPQHVHGRLVFEPRGGALRRDLDLAPMAGALRLTGGVQSLVDALVDGLESARLLTGRALQRLEDGGGHVTAVTDGAAGQAVIQAERVILAAPPRLAAARIGFQPALPSVAIETMRSVPTWMAGQAKLVAVYARPFWREQGHSGSAISHLGPLVEVHDASPASGSTGALFGFVGIAAAARRADPGGLEQAAIRQLERLFGAPAAQPLAVALQDWASDPWTAVPEDAAAVPEHPAGGLPAALRDLWQGRLTLAASELAPTSPGLLEGALEGADAAWSGLGRSVLARP